MSVLAGYRKWTVTNWEQSSKLILLELDKKLLKKSVLTIPQSFDIWNKLERWKSSVSGCLMCWLKIVKNHILKYHLSLILYNNSESLLRLWHVMKSGFYAMTSSVVGPRNSKALSKAKLAPKKRSWSLFGGQLSVWSTTAFWIPAKPLHLRNMLSKSMRYTKNCSACSQQWSTE